MGRRGISQGMWRSWLSFSVFVLACGSAQTPVQATGDEGDEVASSEGDDDGTFGSDLAFLRRYHEDLVVLEAADARVAIAPAYQGRVMTSSSGGAGGLSYGWIHRALIASGELTPHMNAFGGEDRFWLGPEGGPFALYFPPGAPFEFERWQVPAPIDTEAWAIASSSPSEVRFTHAMSLTNRAGNTLSVGVERTVRLVDASEIAGEGVRAVAYESDNVITNTGQNAWTRETGLASIWILSMYRPSPRTTVVVPFETGSEEERGAIVNADYFGQVPPERLRVDETAGVIFFRADGRERGKIGVPQPRAREWMGSWDAEHGVLTLVQYTLPSEARPYVDSTWREQEDPFAGDVINSYNDGPPEPGAAPLGPFYELESSSPAAELEPGARLQHIHRTFHLEGEREALDAIARARLGTSLDAIEAAFR